jgi:hypothetical protein
VKRLRLLADFSYLTKINMSTAHSGDHRLFAIGPAGDEIMKALIAILLAFSAEVSAAEMYKCVVEGRTSFQQDPCSDKKSGGVVTIRKDAMTPQPTAKTSAVAADSAAVAKGDSRDVSAEKVTRDVGDRIKVRDLSNDIDRAEVQLTSLNGSMERELNALRAKKLLANNNQAGATWESSISAEMNAVTANYSNKIKSLEIQIDSLRKQRDRYLPK